MELTNPVYTSSKNCKEIFFHHSIFRANDLIFKHQDYELETSKLPEDVY